MKETAFVWILTLVCQMADGEMSVASLAKENRRKCIQDSGEVAAMADKAKAAGAIRSYALDCHVIELEITRKFQ